MGANASTIGDPTKIADYIEEVNDSGVGDDCKTFISVFQPLCYKKSLMSADPSAGTAAMSGRAQAWRAIDMNGNGYVSLAEMGKWVKTTCISELKDEEEGTRLYKKYYPSYIRAFKDAADIGKDVKVKGTKTATADDYVQKSEFRVLCCYLCIYAAMWDAFETIDGGGAGVSKDDDRRISITEWTAVVKANSFTGHIFKLLQSSASYADEEAEDAAKKTFAAMDTDGKGMVLLGEFCQAVEDAEANAKTWIGSLLTVGE